MRSDLQEWLEKWTARAILTLGVILVVGWLTLITVAAWKIVFE